MSTPQREVLEALGRRTQPEQPTELRRAAVRALGMWSESIALLEGVRDGDPDEATRRMAGAAVDVHEHWQPGR